MYRCRSITYLPSLTGIIAGLTVAVLCAEPREACADEAGSDRAARAYELDASVVRAWRIDVPRSGVSSPVETLNADEIAARQPLSVADLLDGLSGIRVQRYGGFGAVSAVSLNGTPASHVVVIADGVRLNSPQLGDADLGLWGADSFQSVEVARGGHSALYGADAMSGVVILKRRPPSGDVRVAAATRMGSHGLRGGRIALELPIASGSAHAAVRRDVADNDYPYTWQGRDRRRWNADVRYTEANLDARSPTRRGTWTLRLSQVRRAEGAPGPDTGSVPDASTSRPRQRDTDTVASVHRHRDWDAAQLDATLSLRHTEQTYVDPAVHVDSDHRNDILNLDAQLSRPLGATQMVGGVNGSVAAINSTNTLDETRTHTGAFAMAVHPLFLPEGSPFRVVQLDVAVRADGYSDFGSAVSPRLGVVAHRGGVRLFGNVSRNFRAPPFNALYWQPGGNPELRPESGTHVTAGVGWRARFSDVEVNHQQATLRDQIRWQPTASEDWSAFNLARSHLTVWSGRARIHAGRHWLTLRATRSELLQRDGDPETDSTYGKQVPFVPQGVASAEVAVTVGHATLFARHRWVGRAFTRRDNLRSLPAYALTDVRVRGSVTIRGAEYAMNVAIDNLWDRSYVVMPQYPMPGRSVLVSLEAEL